MKTFLVAGATGFLGSSLIQKLLENGHVVIGTDSRERGYLGSETLDNKNFNFIKADISKSFNECLKDIEIEGIFHLASQQPSSKDLSYADYYKGNVETTLNIINFLKKNEVKFIVYTSTTTILGNATAVKYLNEEIIPSPTNYYGLSKYIAEKILKLEVENIKTKVIIVRYPSIFGKNHLGGLAYTYYQLAKQNKDIDVYGRGEKFRNLIYVEDAVEMLLKVVKNFNKLEKYEVFTAGSRNSLKMIEIARIIKDFLNSKSRVVPIDKDSPLDQDVFVDISKAEKLLAYNPMKIEEGLKYYLEEMKR